MYETLHGILGLGINCVWDKGEGAVCNLDLTPTLIHLPRLLSIKVGTCP